MRPATSALITACLIAGSITACRRDDPDPAMSVTDSTASVTASSSAAAASSSPTIPPPARALDPDAAARVQVALDARLSEVESAVQNLPGLIGSIRQDMRRYLNAEHVAAAQRSGVGPVRDSAHIAALVKSGRLVRLPDSTEWWVLRDLNQSMPYVTPGTKATMEEIGRRFQARLDERGLPHFRLDVTSVLRTGAQQAELRRRNRNASSSTSSHEFGTTFDVAYLAFAAPLRVNDPEAGQLDARLRAYALTHLDTIGKRHAPHLEGELGAVFQEMQQQGRIMTLRERSQPVFHTTVRATGSSSH